MDSWYPKGRNTTYIVQIMFEKERKEGKRGKWKERLEPRRGRTECTEQLHIENLSFTKFREYKIQIWSLVAIITL